MINAHDACGVRTFGERSEPEDRMAPIPKNGDGPKAACIGLVILHAEQAEVVVVTWPHSHSRKAHRATSVGRGRTAPRLRGSRCKKSKRPRLKAEEDAAKEKLDCHICCEWVWVQPL